MCQKFPKPELAAMILTCDTDDFELLDDTDNS